MPATFKHGCNRCHDKHCRSIVEKWRHRYCRDKYEGERPPDRQHGCHGRKPPCDQLRSTRRLQGFADGDKRAEHDEDGPFHMRSEEHTSELQSLMRISYAVFCLKKKT